VNAPAPILPETGFVRLKTVLQIYPVSARTWWHGVRNGQFPKPVNLAHRVTAWRAEDIRALIEKRAA
jgi:prophage regulatory protein